MHTLKKGICLLLALVMMLTASCLSAAMADEEILTQGDCQYRILDDGTVEITKYSGDAIILTVPAEVNGYLVTSIGDEAFAYCNSLTVIVPKGSYAEEYVPKMEFPAPTPTASTDS